MFQPVIIAGGVGTRLWPLSREKYPKQFLTLTDSKHSLFQQTVLRLQGLPHASPLVICNEEHRFMTAEQLRQIDHTDTQILLEPEGRNTAPAIALAALKALEKGKDPILLVLAADHVIADIQAFHHAVEQAVALAKHNHLVTFGIVPTHPHTGYGYIKSGQAQQPYGYRVDSFVEKPTLELATHYLSTGEYYWNSGMFMFKASRYLEELKQYQCDIYSACKAAMRDQTPDLDFIRINQDAFAECPSNSIDYAVMEHTKHGLVVPLDAHWNDVGEFSALWDISQRDEQGNVIKGDVKALDTQNTLILNEDKLVATLGVQDLVIINTKDALLVAHQDHTQKVRDIAQHLQDENRSEASIHREVYRPWGKYDAFDRGERFLVKRITVKPGAKLSKQMHYHRSEHWVVVAGTAKVLIGDKEQYVGENESVYIPIAQVHALENPGKVDLELIEVQSGAYLAEDDIVRFDDQYGRR
ncbi:MULTISPECIES: mannose-1-phosphate guanylyltransferase/mannose-6-phosphate isomerase [Pseudoalteromonas]|uniref:mannose-1-phosphate guanylyltransferase n=1 Tax=Pseudoalteromonas amylolytica TaxID=1859457 RepID=A0A1S1MU87_9GAMM|nr:MULTISPECIES: mannose-1-phosphate guanylyltransferase/mannose-6-phosphate isomerase [Pseudoalteromonas]OHU88510.1 mannose-1-phosphate guanylyltransferase/mannose-6-phosphate isomerase [Pseudoalteromonas sp. JW3]OHU90353.1 mannose-1-phosphate guanylyltransferase/mannose-6-phosphate isomerase [Pseudoalteromonas amylolytica]